MISIKKRLFILIMSLIMILCCFPITAHSVSNETLSVGEQPEATSDLVETELSYWEQEIETDELIGAVRELTALREENVKHFRLANGLYQAVTYASPVHRMDNDGEWQDIDNSLELKTVKDIKSYSTTDSRVSFASKFKYGTELLCLRENGYSIALTPVTSGKVTSSNLLSVTTVKNSEKRSATVFDSVEEAARVDNQTKIVYTNIEENTDIEYVLRGNDIKENIIVNAPSSNYEYSFYLNLTGLAAKLDEYGNVIIADEKTKAVKYTIPAPYMFDSTGEVSYDVYYDLKESGKSKYQLTVTANEKWINEEGRAFPVTIDPTVTQYSGIQDAMVNSSAPNNNYGSSTVMYLTDGRSIYMRAEMPALPIGANISAAWFAMSYYFGTGMNGSMLAGAYQVLSSWNENTITYNNAPSVGTALLSSATLLASSSITSTSPNETSFEITSLANQWYNGTADNYGIIIKRLESATDTLTNARIKSSESDYLPYFNITYTYHIPDGVYALRNAYGSNYWMTLNGNAADGGTIQQKTSTSSPANTDVFDRMSLFKITRVGSVYVIRSMVNNNLTISVSGTSVVTKEIPSHDADVANRDKFYIEWTGNGYLLRPVGTSNVITMGESFETNLTVVPKTSATVMANWNLEQYTGNHKFGGIIYFPGAWNNQGIIEGSDNEISMIGWSTYPNANIIEASVPQEDAELGGIEWDSTTRSGTFSAYSPGRVTIAEKIYHSDGTLKGTANFEFSIVPQVGTYYIRNVGTNKYADVKGPSTSVGTLIHQWDFHTSNQEKWVVEYVPNSGGYIRFKSTYSNLYLGIDPSNTTAIKQYDANNYTSWKIDRTSSGNYILINKATESASKVLSVPLGTTANGTNLTQLTYAADSEYNDEWYLLTKVLSCVNYYDLSMSDELIQNIAVATNFADKMYSKYFGVGIHMDGAAQYCHTSADDCINGINQPCTDETCGTNCKQQHHKNTLAISTDLYNAQREDDHIYVMWSDRPRYTFCSFLNAQHTVIDGIAAVWYGRPVIHFFRIAGDFDSQKLSCMALNLVHEIAHCLGMDDVYNNEGHNDPNGMSCVMEYFEKYNAENFYGRLLDGETKPFCASCNEAMKEHTSSITILGNQ